MSFTVGSDPEVLLVNKQGKLISSIGLIGGSKAEPKATKHGHVQEDNVLVEFNTNPAKSRDEFVLNVRNMLLDIEEIIKPLDLSVSIAATGLFESDQLQDIKAQMSGCEPDYNAWGIGEGAFDIPMNDPPDLSGTPMRSGGGHLHVGSEYLNKGDNRAFFCRIMDLVAAVPSVLMDKDDKRRSLYGKAGAHRPKFTELEDAYDGVEYRVLSNFWLASDETIKWAYDRVDQAFADFESLLKVANKESTRIYEAVNNSNREVANALVKEYGLEVVYG